MAPDERRLLAEISRWRRESWVRVRGVRPPSANGVWPGYETADGQWKVEPPRWSAELHIWMPWDEITVYPAMGVRRQPMQISGVTSIREGVDVLCALQVLPARFSSVYREGVADEENRRFFADAGVAL